MPTRNRMILGEETPPVPLPGLSRHKLAPTTLQVVPVDVLYPLRPPDGPRRPSVVHSRVPDPMVTVKFPATCLALPPGRLMHAVGRPPVLLLYLDMTKWTILLKGAPLTVPVLLAARAPNGTVTLLHSWVSLKKQRVSSMCVLHGKQFSRPT